MKRFTQLYLALDATTRTNEKVAAMVAYFREAAPEDAAWAVFFLSGRRPKRLLPSHLLRTLAAELAGIPEWLLVESYSAVGDSAETAALLLPDPGVTSDLPLHRWMLEHILPVREADEAGQRDMILNAWAELGEAERYVFNKLITGALRVGVSQLLLVRALSQCSGSPSNGSPSNGSPSDGVDEQTIAHRLMGGWDPTPQFYRSLVAKGAVGRRRQPALSLLPGAPAGR